MAHVVCESCIGAKNSACVNVCPVDCIYDGGEQRLINPGACIDCGACAEACPVHAIFFIDEVPAQWQGFIEKNAVLYRDLVQL